MGRSLLVLLSGTCLVFGATPITTFPPLQSATVRAIATDPAGNLYLTGYATPNLPTTPGAFQKAFNPANCTGLFYGCVDAFVAKFSATGQLVYATYLGGSGTEEALAIAVDSAGNAWVTGYTSSKDFPLTPNALQKTNAGGFAFISPTMPPPFQGDAFITGMNATGTALVYSSFLGGTDPDVGNTIVLDAAGNVYVAGQTGSSDFPVTGMLSGKPAGGFVTKFNPAGPSIVYSLLFDVPVKAAALDSAGSIYLVGTAVSGLPGTPGRGVSGTPGAYQTMLSGLSDAYIAKLTPDGTARVYATLLGGSNSEDALDIAVDATGAAWVVGQTRSADFPVTAPGPMPNGGAFLTRLSSDGSALLLSVRIGGAPGDSGSSVLLDPSGNVYVSGITQTSGFVLTPDALESSTCGSYSDFLTKWSSDGTLLYSSYSREGRLAAIDAAGKLYLSQQTGFPQTTAVLMRLDLSADQRPGALACLVNAGSFRRLGIAPGEIVSLFGDRMGSNQPAFGELDANGRLTTKIGNTRVLFDGVPAPLLYADSHQINAIAPWGLKPGINTIVTVESAGAALPAYTTGVIAADPSVFLIQPGVSFQGAILNQDGTVNSKDNPAAPGTVISIFGTGMGLLNPVPQDGEIIRDASHLLQLPLDVLFGLTSGEILYAGAAPMLPAGVIQINVRLPNGIQPVPLLDGGSGIMMRVNNGPVSSLLATVAVQ